MRGGAYLRKPIDRVCHFHTYGHGRIAYQATLYFKTGIPIGGYCSG
jgi:hypothetical protein